MADSSRYGGSATTFASGYPDHSGTAQCFDYAGIIENIHCEQIFTKLPLAKASQRLLPDPKSCAAPRRFLTVGRPNVYGYSINGALNADVATACEVEYKLGGFHYTRIKRNKLDNLVSCTKADIDKAVMREGELALAEDVDARMSCALPALASACTQGANAGMSGIDLGTLANPVQLSRKIDDGTKTYVWDYLLAGQQVIDEMGLGAGEIAAVGPTALKYLLTNSAHATNAELTGGTSSYTDSKFCSGISARCGLEFYAGNCISAVGKTSSVPAKPIYRIMWIKKKHFDMAMGMVLNETGVRNGAGMDLFDTTMIRDGWVVMYKEVIVVGYFII